jgi:hypothetical protein
MLDQKQGKETTINLRNRTGMNHQNFKNAMHHNASYGFVKRLDEIKDTGPGSGRRHLIQLWHIKTKGKRHLNNQDDPIIDALTLDLPNFTRIRKTLNLPITMSNDETVMAWNNLTDFYLPYGEEPLKELYK